MGLLMPEFHVPEIQDRDKVNEILSKSCFEGSSYSFATLYAWALKYHTEIAFYNDALLISGNSDLLGDYFLYPVGKYELANILEVMKEKAEQKSGTLKIVAESCQAKELYAHFGNAFEYQNSRDDWDYVYNSDDLAFLKGNRYHGKRNHISRLMKKYAGSGFSFEPLGDGNIAECMEIEKQWVLGKNDDFDFSSVSRSLLNFEQLGLSGGVLRINGKAIAFTVGEPLTDDTFVIHIEKALPGYDGAYQMINRSFAEKIASKYRYINREEDMGIEGLRASKLSYFPVKMIEKCVLTERK